MSERCNGCDALDVSWPPSFPGFGRDPLSCAFKSKRLDAEFNPDNWNCGTMNALREAAHKFGSSDGLRWDDQSSGVVPVPADVADRVGCIALTWYKNRGRTEGAVVLFENNKTIPLTLGMAVEVVEFFQKAKVIE